MPNLAKLTIAKQGGRRLPTRQKSQFVIDKREYARFPGSFSHLLSFAGIHGHRLFTKHGFAGFQSRENHFAVGDDRSDDTDQIYIGPVHDPAPVIRNLRNIKFARDLGRMSATRAGNGDDARAFTGFEGGNLGSAGKARADNAYADCACDVLSPRSLARYCLLLTAYCLLLTAYCLLQIMR